MSVHNCNQNTYNDICDIISVYMYIKYISENSISLKYNNLTSQICKVCDKAISINKEYFSCCDLCNFSIHVNCKKDDKSEYFIKYLDIKYIKRKQFEVGICFSCRKEILLFEKIKKRSLFCNRNENYLKMNEIPLLNVSVLCNFRLLFEKYVLIKIECETKYVYYRIVSIHTLNIYFDSQMDSMNYILYMINYINKKEGVYKINNLSFNFNFDIYNNIKNINNDSDIETDGAKSENSKVDLFSILKMKHNLPLTLTEKKTKKLNLSINSDSDEENEEVSKNYLIDSQVLNVETLLSLLIKSYKEIESNGDEIVNLSLERGFFKGFIIVTNQKKIDFYKSLLLKLNISVIVLDNSESYLEAFDLSWDELLNDYQKSNFLYNNFNLLSFLKIYSNGFVYNKAFIVSSNLLHNLNDRYLLKSQCLIYKKLSYIIIDDYEIILDDLLLYQAVPFILIKPNCIYYNILNNNGNGTQEEEDDNKTILKDITNKDALLKKYFLYVNSINLIPNENQSNPFKNIFFIRKDILYSITEDKTSSNKTEIQNQIHKKDNFLGRKREKQETRYGQREEEFSLDINKSQSKKNKEVINISMIKEIISIFNKLKLNITSQCIKMSTYKEYIKKIKSYFQKIGFHKNIRKFFINYIKDYGIKEVNLSLISSICEYIRLRCYKFYFPKEKYLLQYIKFLMIILQQKDEYLFITNNNEGNIQDFFIFNYDIHLLIKNIVLMKIIYNMKDKFKFEHYEFLAFRVIQSLEIVKSVNSNNINGIYKEKPNSIPNDKSYMANLSILFMEIIDFISINGLYFDKKEFIFHKNIERIVSNPYVSFSNSVFRNIGIYDTKLSKEEIIYQFLIKILSGDNDETIKPNYENAVNVINIFLKSFCYVVFNKSI